MHRLKKMQDCLVCCVEAEMADLKAVDTKELGEAIDMIKDLSEAIYYNTIVHSMDETEYTIKKSVEWEGHSHNTRKTYMEHQKQGHDKAVQMSHLEKYVQELTHELMEMIEGASTDEKQMLAKKLSMLASKIV